MVLLREESTAEIALDLQEGKHRETAGPSTCWTDILLVEMRLWAYQVGVSFQTEDYDCSDPEWLPSASHSTPIQIRDFEENKKKSLKPDSLITNSISEQCGEEEDLTLTEDKVKGDSEGATHIPNPTWTLNDQDERGELTPNSVLLTPKGHDEEKTNLEARMRWGKPVPKFSKSWTQSAKRSPGAKASRLRRLWTFQQRLEEEFGLPKSRLQESLQTSTISPTSRPTVRRRNLGEEFHGEEVADAKPQTFVSRSLSTGSHVRSEGGMFGETLYSDTSSSSPTNKYLLTSQGYRHNPQQVPTPIQNLHSPDSGSGCGSMKGGVMGFMGEGAVAGVGFMGSGANMGGVGFIGGGVGPMQAPLQASPSYCYGCRSYGYSFPVTVN